MSDIVACYLELCRDVADVYPANPAYAIARNDEAEPLTPRNVQLDAFTAAVNEHLVPRLPMGLRVVCDKFSVNRGDMGRDCFVAWVLDQHGREVHRFERTGWSPDNLVDEVDYIASALMAGKMRGNK